MGRVRTRVERLERLVPDPFGQNDGQIIVTSGGGYVLAYPTGETPRAIFTNGGSALSSNMQVQFEVPYDFVVTGWTATLDAAASVEIDVALATYADYGTSATSLFTASLSTAIKAQDTGLSYAITAGDILIFTASHYSGTIHCASIVLDGVINGSVTEVDTRVTTTGDTRVTTGGDTRVTA